MASSIYKYYDDVWDSNIKHNRKGFPTVDMNDLFSNDDDIKYKIPLEYRYRPDLIAFKFYRDPRLSIALVLANNFSNSPQDFETGTLIRIPRHERLIELL